MPLRDENRIIVRQGLEAMTRSPRPGIQDLLFKMGLAGRRIGAGELAWQICPAINAAGRMGEPDKAVDLLLQGDPGERDRLAGELKALNEERKRRGEETWTVVEPLAEESLKDFSDTLVMAAGEDINRGVTGLMATRLVSRFKKPALVVSLGEDSATGSLRSLRGYKLPSLLEPCADLFRDWGGHNYAAGFSMDRANWPVFLDRVRLASRTIELEESAGEETITVDAELPLSYLRPDIFSLVDRFEPYGEGNSPLTFLVRGVRIAEISLMGKPEAKHVKLLLDTGPYKWPAVYWQAAEKVKVEFDTGDRADLVFKITRNWFNNTETPQLVVFDLKRAEKSEARGLPH
jgi:single-stranded-DNA-specific exonuclease